MGIYSSTWVDSKIDDIENFLALHKQRKFIYILDTNFVIYVRTFVEEKEAFFEKNPSLVEKFNMAVDLLRSKAKMIVYQYACEESSRSKHSGLIDVGKYRYTVRCLNQILNTNFSDKLLSEDTNLQEFEDNSKVPFLKNNGLFQEQSAITYAIILKGFLIKNIEKSLSKEEMMISFVNFLDNELNIVSPAAISFAFHYFGEEKNILKNVSINKEVKIILDKIYAAAIDLMMPTKCSQLSEMLKYEYIPIFITFDKGVKLIFDSLFVNGQEIFNNTLVPKYGYKVFYSSGWKDKEILDVAHYIEELKMKRDYDFKNNLRKHINIDNIYNLCISLENYLREKCL